MLSIQLKSLGTKVLHHTPALGAVSPAQFTKSATQHNAIIRTKTPTTKFLSANAAPALAPINHRFFSALSVPIRDEEQEEDESQFSALSPNLVEVLRAEFESVDINHDGKIDSSELKQLLRKRQKVFSESEILEICELFYVRNAGKGVPIDDLLEAVNSTLISDRKNKASPGGGTCAAEYYYDLNHHQWKKHELDIAITHIEPKTFSDKVAYNSVKLARFGFDTATGWNNEITSTSKVLQRVIFLETVAAVPGMTAAIIRHFKSLRSMERDGGLINMFLEEATNERMHLLTFVTMRDPSLFFRASVIGAQFGFGTAFLLAYIASPKFCHRFVGYIEEEACSTYTKIIEALETAPEGSDLAKWSAEGAPDIGISYWHLGEDGTVLDLIKAVRADEAEHRDVNHSVVNMQDGDVNPRYDPTIRLDLALNKYVKDMMTRPKVETV